MPGNQVKKSKFTPKQNLPNHKSKGEGDGKQVGEEGKRIFESLQIITEYGLCSQLNSKNVLLIFFIVPLAKSPRKQKQGKYLQSI